MPIKKVAFVYERLLHYRIPLYKELKKRLEQNSIEMTVVYGDTSPHVRDKKDTGYLQWAQWVKNRSIKIGSTELLWQECFGHINNADLVVVQQENRMLVNYWLLLRRILTRQKIAFWGHGMNCQAPNPRGLRERFKRLFLKTPDWWFAYTDFTKNILLNAGFPANRITVVNNSIDTTELQSFISTIRETDIDAQRDSLGIVGHMVGVYCGSLYEHKRIDFLLEAAINIRSKIKDFELIVIGVGPEEYKVQNAIKGHTWIHYVGQKYGIEKALLLKLGAVFLMPGGVGLAILDSFVAGMPLITTDCKLHGPEIAYLNQGKNGFITADRLDDYVATVVYILKNKSVLSQMSKACIADAEKYSIDNMARNFTDGVVKALG
jgi:L-malate glycosyltransferase